MGLVCQFDLRFLPSFQVFKFQLFSLTSVPPDEQKVTCFDSGYSNSSFLVIENLINLF